MTAGTLQLIGLLECALGAICLYGGLYLFLNFQSRIAWVGAALVACACVVVVHGSQTLFHAGTML